MAGLSIVPAMVFITVLECRTDKSDSCAKTEKNDSKRYSFQHMSHDFFDVKKVVLGSLDNQYFHQLLRQVNEMA